MVSVDFETSFENLVNFVCDPEVSSVPIDTCSFTPPKLKGQKPKHWGRMFEIVGAYLGTEQSLEEVGREFGLTRQRICQIARKGVRVMYAAQNQDIRDKYPWESFDFNKPLGVSNFRKISEAGGGTSCRVEELYLLGYTLDEIARVMGKDVCQISQVRGILRGWGVNLPYKFAPVLPRFEQLRNPKLTDEDKQRLLDSIKVNGALAVLSSGENPLVVAVSNVGDQAGLYIKYSKASIIYDVLRRNGVPASTFSETVNNNGKKRYRSHYFIHTADIKRAIEVIKGASELDEYKSGKAIAIGKPTDRVPRCAELKKSGEYGSISSLVKKLRGRSYHPRVRAEDIIAEDCPVGVFRYDIRVYYSISDEKALSEYLMRRFEVAGL